MVRLNRTTEYGLMALQHMSRKLAADSQEITSAREISDQFGLPFEITAKTLQRLKDAGLIRSAQGAKGGYTLLRSLGEISLAEFIELMEGPQTLVACTGTSGCDSTPRVDCEYSARCEIHDFMCRVNARILNFLSGIHLAELSEEQGNCQSSCQTSSISGPVSIGSSFSTRSEKRG